MPCSHRGSFLLFEFDMSLIVVVTPEGVWAQWVSVMRADLESLPGCGFCQREKHSLKKYSMGGMGVALAGFDVDMMMEH